MMKAKIGIISNDILFENFFVQLLKNNATEVEVLVYHEDYKTIDKVDKSKCDLLLLDGGIIGISCIEILRKLRINEKVVSPIWFFSEIPSKTHEHMALTMGASRIINKPFDPTKIVSEILLALKK